MKPLIDTLKFIHKDLLIIGVTQTELEYLERIRIVLKKIGEIE